jgi:DNA-binding CsgD family transcriptional regulator
MRPERLERAVSSGSTAGLADAKESVGAGIASKLLGSLLLQGRRFSVYAADDGCVGNCPSGLAGTFQLCGQCCVIIEMSTQSANGRRDPAQVLTARELQIAALIARGSPTKQCAYRLRISEWTVQTHLRRIYAKLNVAGRAEMVFRCANLLE